MKDVFSLPLAQLQRALRDGRLTSVALAEAAIAGYHSVGERLQAYKARDEELLLRDARLADAAFASGQDLGALQGIPVSIKDLFGLQGYPVYAGAAQRLPAQFENDGPLVARLRRQCSVFTGKTHTVEFAFGGLGTNSTWGTPWNPWDAGQHRVPGGSSAGAGVSLVCDALVALGTDTAGSVRIPAGMTGQVGLKTSYGRWSTEGIVPLSSSMDSAGLLTRSVADLRAAVAALDSGFGDPDAAPAELTQVRAGVIDEYFWEECSPGIAETVQQAIGELERAGVRLRRVTLPELQPMHEIFMLGHLAAAELQEFLESCLPGRLQTLTAQVASRVEAARTMSVGEYLRRRRVLRDLGASAAARLADVDVLLTPTVAVTPPVVAELVQPDAYRRANLLALRNTCPGNLLSLCGLTLPVGLDAQRMPVGLQLMARHGSDDKLLLIAAAFERLLGNSTQRLGRAPLAA